MTDFSENGTIRRREENRQIMDIVSNALRPGSRPEELEYRTGLDADAVRLALNLLHTKDLAISKGGLWYKPQHV